MEEDKCECCGWDGFNLETINGMDILYCQNCGKIIDCNN